MVPAPSTPVEARERRLLKTQHCHSRVTAVYRPICDRIGSQFKPAVIERHGHCGDGMCSVIKLLSGDGERSAMEDDISFTAPSKTTFVAQHLVFAAVMADAGMVNEFIFHAVHRVPRGAQVVSRS